MPERLRGIADGKGRVSGPRKLGTKRVEHMAWFTMVGAIANDSGSQEAVTNDGSPVPHQYVELCRHQSTPLRVTRPGYLYCFPNDVWALYANNRGSIELRITRTG